MTSYIIANNFLFVNKFFSFLRIFFDFFSFFENYGAKILFFTKSFIFSGFIASFFGAFYLLFWFLLTWWEYDDIIILAETSPTFAKRIFHREAISSDAGGFHPPQEDFIRHRRISSDAGGFHPPKVDFILCVGTGVLDCPLKY